MCTVDLRKVTTKTQHPTIAAHLLKDATYLDTNWDLQVNIGCQD